MAEKSENSQKSTTTESEWLRSYFYYFYSYLEVFLESTQFQHYYYFYLRDADIKTFTHLRRSRLTFSQQIPICFLIRQRLREIFQIKAFAIRVTCFLVPEADYRNSLLYSQPHHKPHRLQSVLKKCSCKTSLRHWMLRPYQPTDIPGPLAQSSWQSNQFAPVYCHQYFVSEISEKLQLSLCLNTESYDDISK